MAERGPIFIANRGEIAVRIIRTARSLGLPTIAIHSDADAGALWTRLADTAVAIGGTVARESYLDIEKVVAAARDHGAAAVHPGYGLLSENAEFADAVRGAGMVFIGPSAESIAVMGDKVRARAAALACGVPVLPGSSEAVEGVEAALAAAEAAGWPVLVKASFGGGGRGMRVAHDRAELAEAIEQAAREAGAAFGKSQLFIERYLARARHVEVQVIGDAHGNVLHLGDRDCSLQRRRQKLVEEAPAPDLPDALRAELAEAAIRLARSVEYLGVGTVEFLVDVEGARFFFLEMNTRLQVEHGVTEMVTGLDLVALQIAVANGAPLPIRQDEVRLSGHAIQARISAEDPGLEFQPSPGRVASLDLPGGPGIRCDFAIAAGDEVPPFYDSMFGKVMAWGPDRASARVRLGQALEELRVGGVASTAPFARALVASDAFADVAIHTGWVEEDWSGFEMPPQTQLQPIQQQVVAPRPSRVITLPWGDGETRVTIHDTVATRADTGTAAGGGAAVRDQSGAGSDMVVAPIDGAVVKLAVEVGQAVAKGELLVVLDAMKMELAVRAPRAATVSELCVSAGEAVKQGRVLVRFG